MTSINKLKIKLEREEKEKLDAAAEVMDEIMALLIYNKDAGFPAFQEGLDIYDSFWKIYDDELIP